MGTIDDATLCNAAMVDMVSYVLSGSTLGSLGGCNSLVTAPLGHIFKAIETRAPPASRELLGRDMHRLCGRRGRQIGYLTPIEMKNA